MNTKNLAPRPQRTQRSRGFTLIELLIVVAIVAILAALAFPALKNSLEVGRKAKCLSNLKQLGQATLTYAADNEQNYPPFVTRYSKGGMTFWYLEIRPYLGAKSPNFQPGESNIPTFYCPSMDRKRGYPHTDYGANTFVFPPSWTPDECPQTKVARIPSPSKIAMYSEVLSGGCNYDSSWQLVATTVKQNPDQWFPHRHGETVNMVFCDGHAQNVPRSEVVANFTNYFGSGPVGE